MREPVLQTYPPQLALAWPGISVSPTAGAIMERGRTFFRLETWRTPCVCAFVYVCVCVCVCVCVLA